MIVRTGAGELRLFRTTQITINLKLMKTAKEKEIWESCQYRMNEEGFDYCFDGYSKWDEIKDENFHKLRESYLESAKNLKEYINKKAGNPN